MKSLEFWKKDCELGTLRDKVTISNNINGDFIEETHGSGEQEQVGLPVFVIAQIQSTWSLERGRRAVNCPDLIKWATII